MKYEQLLINAFRNIDLSVETHPEFFQMWEEVEYGRSDFITSSGKIERHFYVVVSGVQAIYILTKEGDKQVIGFSFDGSFSGVYDSFLMEKPSYYFLEALAPTKLLRINKQNYDRMFEIYPVFDRWGRLTHQDLLVGRVQREIELITLSAKERYETFMDRCPEKLRTIPQKYLASYLNMTPETFSRLRKEKS
ncbi:MAG: Crp/Fnr family transcriptional regulator [Crocinitomicaceae bacterium]|nr:Crp/Fnr family transcriptional regulator [Crocinitomicaceae bacterium]